MIRLFENRIAGDLVAHGVHKGIAWQCIVGNDIQGTGIFGEKRTYRTLITQSIIDGKRHYACHVIMTRWTKSKINSTRIKEAIESWKCVLDEHLQEE